MKRPIYQIDAFCQRPFEGNPAAVVLLDKKWLPSVTLQKIASENNLSETAFVLPRKDGYALRWFTPAAEVDLCGHATLAAAYVLFEQKLVQGKQVVFQTLSGDLTVTKCTKGLLEMDFPARPGAAVDIPAGLAEALGVEPEACFKCRDLMAILPDESMVRNLKPDYEALARLERDLDVLGIMVTAPGDVVDFVSRFFAPSVGLNEDPVTGSAHCTLMPYWSQRLKRDKLHARQVSKRGGELSCELRGDRVIMSGSAVKYMEGFIWA